MYFKNELFGLSRVRISEVPISEDLLYYCSFLSSIYIIIAKKYSMVYYFIRLDTYSICLFHFHGYIVIAHK